MLTRKPVLALMMMCAAASAQCLNDPSSISGTTINTGESLVVNFTIQPNSSDLLTLFVRPPYVVTGTPVITTSLFNGPNLLGTYSQAARQASTFIALFQSARGRTNLDPNFVDPPPTRVDFTSLNSGATVGTLIVRVSGGSISFGCAQLVDNVINPTPGFTAQQNVQVTSTRLVASRTRTIQASDFAANSPQTISGVQVKAAPSSFSSSVGCGITAVGVAGGFVNGEIDTSVLLGPPPVGAESFDPRENVTFNYPRPTVITQLTLGFLFMRHNDDVVNETAQIQVNNGVIYELTATGLTTALWTGSGRVANVSPAMGPSCGVWTLVKPFGDTPVTSLKFVAKSDVFSSSGSDFAIVNVSDEEPEACLNCGCSPLDPACRTAGGRTPLPATLPDWTPATYACTQTGIDVAVCNQGTASGEATLTSVVFGAPSGATVQLYTNPMAPGTCQMVSFPAPAGWCVANSSECSFSIKVNAAGTPWPESNTGNNTLQGNCRVARSAASRP